MQNTNFVLSWYITSVFALAFSLLLLVNTSFVRSTDTPMQVGYQKYRALPNAMSSENTQEVSIGKSDARSLIVYKFFKENRSPLADMADTFVGVADRYNLDFRLLPAISMQESNGGKKLPQGSYNPFGYGIYGSQILKFHSFEDAIDRVARSLREDYINQGLKSPQQIMTKYTPPSLLKGGTWAIGVSAFMEQLR